MDTGDLGASGVWLGCRERRFFFARNSEAFRTALTRTFFCFVALRKAFCDARLVLCFGLVLFGWWGGMGDVASESGAASFSWGWASGWWGRERALVYLKMVMSALTYTNVWGFFSSTCLIV